MNTLFTSHLLVSATEIVRWNVNDLEMVGFRGKRMNCDSLAILGFRKSIQGLVFVVMYFEISSFLIMGRYCLYFPFLASSYNFIYLRTMDAESLE
jgi:hypothetical protein